MKISDLKSLFLEIKKKNCLLCGQAPPARCMVESAWEQDYSYILENWRQNKQTNKVTTKKAEGLGSLKLVFLVATESLVCQSGKDYLEADI